MISGKPVCALTSVTGRPAAASGLGRAARRQERVAVLPDERRREFREAALVADREEGELSHGR